MFATTIRIARRLHADRSGVTAIEYGLIAGAIAVSIITTVIALGSNLNTVFTTTATGLNSVGSGGSGGSTN
jgi:pilus assembly protein Flp/PilA